MKDVSVESQKRKYRSLLEVVGNPTATVDIFGDAPTPSPLSVNPSMLGSMPSLLTPWISSHVTAFDDLKLWGRKRLKTAHPAQVGRKTSYFCHYVFTSQKSPYSASRSLFLCRKGYVTRRGMSCLENEFH